MQPIKFRAWNKHKKKMISWGDLQKEDQKEGLDMVTFLNGEYANYKPLQYTGFQDKDGTDIYEGDVIRLKDVLLKDSYSTGVVFFQDGQWLAGLYVLNMVKEKCEVYGNIYEGR